MLQDVAKAGQTIGLPDNECMEGEAEDQGLVRTLAKLLVEMGCDHAREIVRRVAPRELGWRVIEVWECELHDDEVLKGLPNAIRSPPTSGQ